MAVFGDIIDLRVASLVKFLCKCQTNLLPDQAHRIEDEDLYIQGHDSFGVGRLQREEAGNVVGMGGNAIRIE